MPLFLQTFSKAHNINGNCLERRSSKWDKAMLETLINSFEAEFGAIADKFEVLTPLHADRLSNNEMLCKPGVYVFYRNETIWKVGKHNINARKRALRHFRDDTGSNIGKGMKKFENDPDMNLVLFLLKNEKDLHWIYALECFFENRFRDESLLEIHSKRL